MKVFFPLRWIATEEVRRARVKTFKQNKKKVEKQLKNRNGFKGMFQIKETGEVINPLLYM